MAEFWESSFRDKLEMWGFEPADSAISSASLFRKEGFQEILIPGFGYGRNAKPFIDYGFAVTGVEISKTAIELAKKYYGNELKVHHGAVEDMPFDEKVYDGIFCYALIHLLEEEARYKLISDCYKQLRPGGCMIFVAISKNTPAYGGGVEVGKDRFETRHGIKLFFYDLDSVEREFGTNGLTEAKEIEEPAKNMEKFHTQTFWMITCQKPDLPGPVPFS